MIPLEYTEVTKCGGTKDEGTRIENLFLIECINLDRYL